VNAFARAEWRIGGVNGFEGLGWRRKAATALLRMCGMDESL
jgi:hypothetical protein